MEKLILTRGEFALIDDADFMELSRYPWYCTEQRYASTGKYPNNILMHRLVMNCPEGYVVDHINGNTLDNRKCNLQIITHAQNLMRAGKMAPLFRKLSSCYKGLTLDKRTKKYHVRCTDLKGATHSGGSFKSEVEAALAYNTLCKKLRGDLAVLNEVDTDETI